MRWLEWSRETPVTSLQDRRVPKFLGTIVLYRELVFSGKLTAAVPLISKCDSCLAEKNKNVNSRVQYRFLFPFLLSHWPNQNQSWEAINNQIQVNKYQFYWKGFGQCYSAWLLKRVNLGDLGVLQLQISLI